MAIGGLGRPKSRREASEHTALAEVRWADGTASKESRSRGGEKACGLGSKCTPHCRLSIRTDGPAERVSVATVGSVRYEIQARDCAFAKGNRREAVFDPNEWNEGCTAAACHLSIKQNRSVGAPNHFQLEPSPRARVSATSLARHVWPKPLARHGHSPQISACAGTRISARRFQSCVCWSLNLRSGPSLWPFGGERGGRPPVVRLAPRPNGRPAGAVQIVTRHILGPGKPIPAPFRRLPRRLHIPV
jgi:hypothetical protein